MPNRIGAALLAVSLVAAPAAAAQVVVGTPPHPPSVPPVPGTRPARVVVVQEAHDSLEVELRRMPGLSDSITAAATKNLGKLDRLGHLPAHIEAQIEAARARAEAAHARAEAARERAERNADMRREMVEISGDRQRLTTLVRRLGMDPQGVRMPPIDSIVGAAVTIPAGTRRGRIAALDEIEVLGTIDGDAIVLGGDVVVRQGGRITGDAVAVGGSVRLDGGTVEGEMRSLDRALVPRATPTTSSFGALVDRLQTTMGLLILMVLLGFATLVFAEERLRNVTAAIEDRYGKSLLIGLLAEVSFLPVLIIVPIVLAVTIIGIVVIPFAVAAIVVGTVLLVLLGFLAVSRVIGQGLTRRSTPASVRGAEVRAMLGGLFFFAGLWLAGGLLGWIPILGTLVNALAFVVTWAAATVGLGAAIITRGGKRPRLPAGPPADAAPEVGWQTPTPISGVAAARGPITTSSEL